MPCFQPVLACLYKSTGRAIALPLDVGFGVGIGGVSDGGVSVNKLLNFYNKVFYGMGKALSSELSCM